MAKPLTPRQAETLDDLCGMPRDNVGTDEHWIIVDGAEVTIAAQVPGSPSTAKVSLPRSTFSALIDWYNTGRWRNPKKRKAAAGVERQVFP